MPSDSQRSVRRFSGKRLWAFRIGAAALPLLVLAIVEGGLTLLGLGAPDPTIDPFVGFSSVQPLFELNPTGEAYQISPGRLRFFEPDQFAAVKPAGTFRVFCLGESTTQGNPYSPETAYPMWLKLALQVAEPDRPFEVVNCGGISYASYRLVPILRECLQYEPDLFIVCVGHNEFLEDRTYGHLQQVPEWAARSVRWLTSFRTTHVLCEAVAQLGWQRCRVTLTTDTDPMLDYRNGLAAFHRDDEWSRAVALHYEVNLQRMVELARQAAVPLVLMRPMSNLSACPPFKTEPDASISAADAVRGDELLEQARSVYQNDLSAAAELLRTALQLRPRDPLLWYEFGHCLEALHDYPQARAAYLRARDLDVCPLRMTTPLEEALLRVVISEEIPYLDAHELLESQTDHGILGGYWLVDHVHPSFEGHQLIAVQLLQKMAEAGWVQPTPDWYARSQAAFRQHFQSLDRVYFHEGQRKLQLLKEWTKGNADGPPVESRFPSRVLTEIVPPGLQAAPGSGTAAIETRSGPSN
ncbi:GDSL-type esterase/lipase family protein [Planctomicrobium sp. SH664]|uniref:GDSL-type esterase/lipase family protein n=1 Tax=Planctomicrobium sp. SH664 TaxID=3448125 RepID=UPI003F5BE152